MKKDLQSKDLKDRIDAMIKSIEQKNQSRIQEEEFLGHDIKRDII